MTDSQQNNDDQSADSLWPKSLRCYEITLSTAAGNLALDEALLAAVEADAAAASLRFWQPENYFVVLGRSNRVETEVNLEECLARGIPILRRASGGGTVLIGPGCLCYTLALPLTSVHRKMGISRLATELMSRTATGLSGILPGVTVCGTSDLVHTGLKFSGNAQRWLRQSLIHHGTLLFDFDLSLIQQCLVHPSREPAYRQSRRHGEFVMNVESTSDELKRVLRTAWNGVPADCPAAILNEAFKIAESRYESEEWCISPGTWSAFG